MTEPNDSFPEEEYYKDTRHPDYTRHEQVLKACGWTPAKNKHWHSPEQGLVAYFASPTMQELWGALCRACERVGWDEPEIRGQSFVTVAKYWDDPKRFLTKCYGTLNNTIAAALHTVLQQAEKKER